MAWFNAELLEISACGKLRLLQAEKLELGGKRVGDTGHASPAAAKILKEKGISPDEVKGTGKDGRITKEDAEKAEKSIKFE